MANLFLLNYSWSNDRRLINIKINFRTQLNRYQHELKHDEISFQKMPF